MNKLLFAVLSVCAAFSVQAAAIKWFANNIKVDNEGSANAKDYVAFSFIQSADASSSEKTIKKFWPLDSALAAIAKGDRSKFSVDAGNAISSASVNNGIVIVPAYADENWSDATEAVKSYVIVFNAATVADATHYLVLRNGDAKVLETKFAEQSDEVAAQFGSQAANLNYVKIGEPAPVPEPTSGVLLVLGLAGLALRRRTA